MVILKQLNPRGRPRGKGGSPICSSLPRHGARIRTKTQSITERRKKKQKKKKPRADCKLAQKKKKNRAKIYMMHEQFKCHDACFNAVNLSSNSQN